MPRSLSLKQSPVKPTSRLKRRIVSEDMAKTKTRRKKTPGELKHILARNARARAEIQFKGAKNKVVAIVEASGGAKVNKLVRSSVQNMLLLRNIPHSEIPSASLEQLEGLAHALKIEPYQLLIPDLDPAHPQVAKIAEERRAPPPVMSKDQVKEVAKEAVREALTELGGKLK
jgi:hypothetical protein